MNDTTKPDDAGDGTSARDVARTIENAIVVHSPKDAKSPATGSAAPTAPDKFIDEMNREWAMVLTGTRAVILRELDRTDIDPYQRICLLSIEAFRQYLQNRSVSWLEETKDSATGDIVTRQINRNAATFWLKHSRRRTFDGLCFFPNPDGSPSPGSYFNLWQGYSVTPDTGPASDRWQKYKTFRDHLRTNVCRGDTELFDWVFTWMAHLLQRPRERLGTALVMRGRKGTGKTITGEILGSLIASHYLLVDDERYLTGQFNSHMAHCLLLQVDEGMWAGSKQNEGRLKGLITSAKQMIEHKGLDPIPVDNFVHLIITSNDDWVVPASSDERRFAVLDVGEAAMQNHGYFAEMLAEMDAGGREALLADLLAFNLDASTAPNLRQIPQTKALLEQKLQTLDAVAAWWHGRLETGAPTQRMAAWPSQPVAIQSLYADFVTATEKTGVHRKPSESRFGSILHDLVPGLERKKRRVALDADAETHLGGSPQRRWCYELPSLDDCRRAFEERLQQSVDWPVCEEAEQGAADELDGETF